MKEVELMDLLQEFFRIKTIEEITQEVDSIPKDELEKWYEEMNRQFEEDSKTHDFSIPEEWDRDFRRVMGIDELDEQKNN